MLTLAGSEENTCFKFIGMNNSSKDSINLISSSSSLLSDSTSILSSANSCGMDTCSFYSEPSDSTIFAFGESYADSDSVSYSGSESCGSIAFSGSSESCGSIATSSFSSSSSSGGCSYSC